METNGQMPTRTEAETRDGSPQAGLFDVEAAIEAIKLARKPKMSGWPELDALGVQFHAKELTLIAARTGHGKTTAMLNLLLNWLEDWPEEVFLFYSYEVPVDALLVKMLCAVIRRDSGESWPYYVVRDAISGNGEKEGPDPEILEAALEKCRSWSDRLVAVYEPGWNVDELAAHARSVAGGSRRVGAVVVDYLQLVTPPPSEMDRPELAVAFVARRMKRLSVQLGCPVVTAAQMSRLDADATTIPHGRSFDALPVQEALKRRRPQLRHLAFGASEQEADVIMGLLNYRADFAAEREDVSTADRNAPGPFDVCVLKNRFGSLGVASLLLEGQTGLIRGLSFRQESSEPVLSLVDGAEAKSA